MRSLACSALFLLALAPASPADPPPSNLDKKIDNFTLTDTTGKPRSLDDFKDRKAVVVVFVGTECPINNAYVPRLIELAQTYEAKGVQFLAINANRRDTPELVAEHARQNAIPFPVLKDDGNVVADRFGAQRTPEAFVLDAGRAIRYRGRIDDQFGVGAKRTAPTRRDLAEALDEVLAGKPVSKPTTAVAGCFIARVHKPKPAGSVTYDKEVARILQKNCQECHRAGQIGPMPLVTYDDARDWSDTIKEVVRDGRMPPWLADPGHGKFANDRRLSGEEREALLAWIDQGCPRGDDKDLPPPPTFAADWRVGKPDAVYTMDREFTVPAKMPARGVPYQKFVVDPKFEEDVWVQAAEARPGNRAVVHHIIVYIIPPEGRKKTDDGIGQGLLVAYAPGDEPLRLAPGSAKKITKGSKLVFQMHYTPNGVEQTDRSSVGLIFAKGPPQYEVRTRAIAQQIFGIPAGAANHKVTSHATFDHDAVLLSLFPHMHLRGKSFEYRVVYPDGKSDVLLSVPHWDFNWQGTYRLEQPLKLPAGTRIECTAYYDNSAGNPNNPDPTKAVAWGDQTWEEMMIGFVDYANMP
jgi:thiol-disulfide isomerase/thioredoxin